MDFTRMFNAGILDQEGLLALLEELLTEPIQSDIQSRPDLGTLSRPRSMSIRCSSFTLSISPSVSGTGPHRHPAAEFVVLPREYR
jgi:hypothetical protein